MDNQQEALGHLIKLSIPFEIIHHPAVFTIGQVEELGLDRQGMIVKNLFLRDAKGTRHFLVVLSPDKHADLQHIHEASRPYKGLCFPSRRLSR